MAVAAFAIIVVLVAQSPVPEGAVEGTSGHPLGASGLANPDAGSTPANIATRCPWLKAALDRHESPTSLARLVLRRMTVREKLGEIVLVHAGANENVNAGVRRLCIPVLTLQDGPQGVAFGAVGVTQLPAPLGIAATFDTSVARAYGQVEGSEASGLGIDVLQGPNLNIDRVPQNGRSYEGFGEDPALVSAMGVANIEGIQSQGTLAMAKHFAVYSQETDRGVLNDAVSQQALEEIYFPPFKAAVDQAHVATAMCAYPQLNGTYQCQNGALLGQLAQWGFTGFVRSDLGSVHDPVAAIVAGTDLIKPATVSRLTTLVREHRLPLPVVDAAVTRVLTQLFASGLVGRQGTDLSDTDVDSPAHAAFALSAAERSAVLLQNTGSVLPLRSTRRRSLVVIGADAGAAAVTTGYGSSRVIAPFVSAPLAAIRRRAGSKTSVAFSNGGSTTGNLPPIPTRYLTPPTGVGHGLTLTLSQTDPDGRPVSLQAVQPTVDVSLSPHPTAGLLLPGSKPSNPVDRLRNPLAPAPRSLSLGGFPLPPRTHVVLPAGWSDVSATWTGVLTPPKTGLYTFSLQGVGAANLTLDGTPAVSDMLSHGVGRWSQSLSLVGGHPYRLHLDWEPIDRLTPTGETSLTPSSLTVGWEFSGGRIAAAVKAARKADTAVVFAGDFNSEAFDRPSLTLPGDENALIAAVAAVNPRTVVVLNTGGPVVMPWLGQVKGVIEAWYPGEQDGTAIAALLFGDADPSGRLPVTFPNSNTQAAVHSDAQWPGVGLTANYSEGLDVGYRYDHANGIQPLFPFGFGLSYTRFSLTGLSVTRPNQGAGLRVVVTNTGARSGTDVPQAYLTYPAAANEPPVQLVAFAPVTLGPGQSQAVTLSVPASAFEVYRAGSWTTMPGSYQLSVGESSSDLPLTATVTVP